MNTFQETRRSLVAGGLAVIALGSAALAAPIPTTVDKPVTITFYNYNLASAGIGADATRLMIQEFMAANPKITVNAVGVPSPDMGARVQADIVAGRPPDVGQMVFSDLDFIVHNLGAKALEDIVPADEMAAHFQGMSPNGLKLGVMDKKTYGLAYTFSTPVLFYNADLFRQAGLDPDKPPRTWDELKRDADQIHAKTGKAGFVGGMFGSAQADWLYQGLVLSAGGRVLSEDRKRLTFGEPAALEPVRVLREMAASGAMPNLSLEQTQEIVGTGNAGMYLQTSALQTFLINASKGKFELRDAAMPAYGDKPTHPTNSGSALMIFSTDPLKQRAAWELMKFLTSKHGYTIITSQIGYLPLRTDIVDDPEYLGNWVKEHPLVRPNLEQLSRLSPWESFPGQNYHQIEKMLVDAVEQAVFGKDDPATVMADAQRRAQQLMPQ